jgi:peptidoglycan/xylan/chitin deacetylase (PgdA/CDA1 family)
MQVLLTFDYELFFGTYSGSAEKCILEPTEALLNLSQKYNAPMTFFVDTGYLLKLEKYAPRYPELQRDLSRVKHQIAKMLETGCSVQLHIHPHWERSLYDGRQWQIVTDGCYKLDDFTDEEIEDIVRRHHSYLKTLTGKLVNCYRAGGWCIQPFERVKHIFRELGITIDSSVFPGGTFQSPHYDFDFTSVPRFTQSYRFENDVCENTENGSFTEYPIASWKYSPLFYWRLYVLGRLFPAQHKMMGDGHFLAQPGRKQSVLTHFTWNHVSADGYYAGQLVRQSRFYEKKGIQHFVVIGHPKGLTRFALEQLENFLSKRGNKYDFKAFSDLA